MLFRSKAKGFTLTLNDFNVLNTLHFALHYAIVSFVPFVFFVIFVFFVFLYCKLRQLYIWMCSSLRRAQPLFSHIYIIYYSFCPPKDPSIFGLHRQRWCQSIRLGHDCVASIGIYVPWLGLG